jgi:1-deoxyxylulose-5-phosphate synthase
MKRREFIGRAAMGLGAAWLAPRFAHAGLPSEAKHFSAADVVTLGGTGIKTSRLAMGTGTVGYDHHSNQTALGIGGLSDLLVNGYEHGLRFFDLADSYGSHPHAAAALKRLPRDKVTIMTKSWSRDEKGMRADLDRFRRELGTDYLDLVMMHCLTEENWSTKFRGAMDALSEAKEKGIIRAHGCSCHSIGALREAARTPWVEVDLARFNPINSHMDADTGTVFSVLKEMKAAGKAVIGMKILGQGDMRTRVDEGLRHALTSGVLDAFTIGAESITEQDDLIRRMSAV